MMGVVESLEQFRHHTFYDGRGGGDSHHSGQVAEIDIDQSRVMLGLVEVYDKRLGVSERICLATCPSGGENLKIDIFHPAPNRAGGEFPASWLLSRIRENPALLNDPLKALHDHADHAAGFETFALEDLYPSVRQTILTDLVGDFFRDLKAYTEKSFNLSSDMLVKYSSSHSRLDWLSRFVFRVVTEGKVESFIQKMRNGEKINLSKLADLVNEKETASSFHNEPVLTQAAQEYLAKLMTLAKTWDGASGPGAARPTVLRETHDFIKFLKQNNLQVDFWEAQNIWHSLVTDGQFLAILDQEQRQTFKDLGQALNFEWPSL
jgi:hypothetical protein